MLGETLNLTATTPPDGITWDAPTWTSSNLSVATITPSIYAGSMATVESIGVGTAIISATINSTTQEFVVDVTPYTPDYVAIAAPCHCPSNEGISSIAGIQGPPGTSVLHGVGPPDDAYGNDDEWYIDNADPEALVIYGPKSGGLWGAGFPLVGGADLSTEDPLPLGIPDPGTGTEASAWDHVHAHGDQSGGTLHADVIASGASGFMSGTQATQLAGLVAADFPAQISGLTADLSTLNTTVGGHTTQISTLTSGLASAVAVNVTQTADIAANTADIATLNGRTLAAGGGLTGGGTLAADRSFAVGQNADNSIVVNADDIQLSPTLQTAISAATSGISALNARNVIAGAGLIGGGTLAADRTFDVGASDSSITVAADGIAVSSALQTAISANTSDISSLTATVSGLPSVYVPQSRTILAGAGLAGGGDLSADRTLAIGAHADGSIAVNADDIQVGILATDAQHGNRGGGTLHAAVVAGGDAGFMTGAQATQLATNTTAISNLAAAWPITVSGVQQARHYLIDNDSGDDTNTGYVDAPVGTTINPAGLALKTLERLFQLLPKIGNSRWVVVLCKARSGAATYLKQDGVTADSILTAGMFGYSFVRFSGSTDLTNSASDQITQGFEKVVTGPNGDGSFSIGAASTTTLLNLAAGTLSADPAVVQYRIRFSPTTTTVALRNQCRVITANASGSVTLGNALSATPTSAGTADTFFIERPGFVVDKVDWSQGTPQDSTGGFLFFNVITGVRCATTAAAGFTVSAPSSLVVGCEQSVNQAASAVSLRDMYTAGIRDAYSNEALAAVTLGMGLRAGSPVAFSRITSLNVQCLGMMRVGGVNTLNFVYATNGGFGNRCYCAGTVDARTCGTPGGSNLGETFGFIIGDTSSTNAAMRVVAGQILFSQTSGGVRRLDFASCTSACIKLTGMGCTLVVDGCTGTSGNTDAGIDMSTAVASTLVTGRSSANTVSGTAGDIRVAGTAITTHAALTLVGFDDNAGNKMFGTGTAIVSGCRLLSNQSGGALAVGDAVRGNGTTGQVTSSQGITDATVASIVGIAMTPAASATNVYIAPPGGFPYALFDGTPTDNAIVYLSPGTIRKFTTTIPATGNQRLRCGRVVSFSGSTGQIAFCPEMLAQAASTGVP